MTCYLFACFKAVKHFNDVFMMKTSHDINLTSQILQLFFTAADFWDELQSDNLFAERSVSVIMKQLEFDVSPTANIMTSRLTLTYVTFDVDLSNF